MSLILEINELEKTGVLLNQIKHRTGITVTKLILYFTYENIKYENDLIIFDKDKFFNDIKITFKSK